MDWRALAAQILTEGLECFLHGYYRSAFQAAYTTVAVLCNKEYQKGQVGDNFYFLEGVHDICRDKRFSAHLSDLRGSLVGMHDRRKSIVHLEYETPGQTETLTHLETAFLFVQRVDALPPNDVVETFQSALETCRRVPAEGDRQGPTDDWPA